MHASERKLSSKPFAQNSQGKLRLQHPFHDGFVGCPSCHPTNSVKALKAAAKLHIIHASCNKMIRDVNSSSLDTRRRDLRAPAAGARHWLSIDICCTARKALIRPPTLLLSIDRTERQTDGLTDRQTDRRSTALPRSTQPSTFRGR